MNVTICGPNLRDQSRGDFHVHAAGCADLARGAQREPEYRNGWTIDADSRLDVANEVYADIIDENGEEDGSSYLETMHFFPCCAELPVKPATTHRVIDLNGYEPDAPDEDVLMGYGVMAETAGKMTMLPEVYGGRSEAAAAVAKLDGER
jgi:hypothetical protein